MALVLVLKSVEGLPGKSDRLGKVTFRGLTYETKRIKAAKKGVYFGESFDWPIARNIEAEETLSIDIYNHNTYLSNKLIGSYTLVLQQIIRDGELKICEPLIDANNRLIETTVTFEVKYYSPDGKVGRWEEVEFQYPLVDQWAARSGVRRAPGGEDTDSRDGDGQSAQLDGLSQRLPFKDEKSADDSSSVLSFGAELIGGEDTAEEQAAMEALQLSKQARHGLLDQELHKPRDFQVNITVVEAQQLAGLNIDPVVKVTVGDDVRFTAIKQSTNCPFFSEYFVFDYRESPIMLFDKIITITVYDATRLPGRSVLKAGRILAGSVIGAFKCDVGTVYATPDHQFYRRWAVLLDPKDILEGPKGFVKCDISIIGKGDVVKTPKSDKDEDNIEGNLLLPAGVPMDRQRAAYRVIVYRAEDLPRMDSGIMASVRKAITMDSTAFIDAYVKVSFVGHVGKTSVKKSYNPEWKEQLTFIDMFPPLCNRIKVQLYDNDTLRDEAIATHFIELPQIMDPGGDTEGILPTFGPSWLNFYGAPRNYKVIEFYTSQNEGLGEGCAYRGRLMLCVKTELLDSEMGGPTTVYKDKVHAAGKTEVAPKREFLLYGVLLDASMIDREHKDKHIEFELSIGNDGNELDAKTPTSLLSSEGSSDEDDGATPTTKLLKKKKEEEEAANLVCHSTSDPMLPESDDKLYYSLPIKEEKPCLYVTFRMEDLRKRLYHTNLLQRMAEKLDEDLEDVRVAIRAEKLNQRYKLRNALDELVKGCDVYLRLASALSVGAGSGKTKLDKHRLKTCQSNIEKVKTQARAAKSSLKSDTVRDHYREAKEFLKRLKHLTKEPQHSLPDVFLWMIVDRKRVAYHRMSANDLLAATHPEQQGKHCGKIQTLFLKRAGKDAHGSGGWSIQAKLLMYFWLGQRDPKRRSKEYLMAVPVGYEQTTEVKKADITPPSVLVYKGELVFQLRAYIYQARSLIGSDNSGLSDPFARVIFWNQCKQTRVVEATLSPTWDEVMLFEKITLYGDPKTTASEAPVIVEFFDYDAVGQPEFLGRCLARPRLKLAGQPYAPPDFPAPLRWWDVYRGHSKAGELLASFELLQGDPTEFPPLPEPIIKDKVQTVPIPPSIKPAVSKHRLEILFWGVREAKRVHLLTVDHPRVDIEVAGHILQSKKIMNIDRNSNFDDPLKYIDLDLPDNELFWPPLNIRVVDCRNFGREVLVGTTTVTSLANYLWLSPEERERRELEKMNAQQAGKGDRPSQSGLGLSTDKRRGSRWTLVGMPDDKNGLGPPTGSRAPSVITDQPASIHDPASQSTILPSPTRLASRLLTSALRPVGGILDKATSVSQYNLTSPATITEDGMVVGGVAIQVAPGHVVIEVPPDGSPPPGGFNSYPDRGGSTVGQLPPLPPGYILGPAGNPIPAPLEPGVEPTDLQVLPAVRKNYKELIAELDWWSKYHVSKEDKEEEDEEEREKKGRGDDGATTDDDVLNEEEVFKEQFQPLDFAGLDVMDLKKLQELASAGEDDEDDALAKRLKKKAKKKKKKKKKKDRKKAAIERLRTLKGTINQAFSKDDDDDDFDFEPEVEEDKSYIVRIKMYDHELESVPEFKGFDEWAQSFSIFRGKKVDDDEDDMVRVVGKFKGTMCVYKLEDPEVALDASHTHNTLMPKLKLADNLKPSKPYEMLVRVYIVQAFDLHPADLNGKADPYIVIKCGRREKNDKENRIHNTLTPVFGKMFEFNVVFPMDSTLRIQVVDYDALSSDDLIGETFIDMENRFLSKYRGSCGIASTYEIFGYNSWRDPMKPTQIVGKLCKDHNVEPPQYGRDGVVKFSGFSWRTAKEIENEQGEVMACEDHMALEVIKHWSDIPQGFPLVPEHLETRHLYNPEKPGVSQGKLQMWVDMFPKDKPTPSHTVDITPRKPIQYELRCVIWNTDDVVLEDTNPLTGEASSDIFIRACVLGMGEDDQSTDVHYRSLDGEGNFNWRMIFPFDYLKAEEKVTFKKKESVFALEESELRVPCKLTIQVWDADLVSADDFLGAVTLDLNRMPRPCKDAKNCTLKMLAPEAPRLNLFKQKRCKGWWPMEAKERKGEEVELIGKVEAELQLFTLEEAEKTPAGLARDAPDPLPEPNRPDSSFLRFMNPLKMVKYVLWKWKWVLLKLLLVVLMILLILLFFYSIPGATVNKMFGTRPDSSFLWFMNPCKTLKYILWKRYKWLLLKFFLIALLVAFIALIIYTSPGAITHSIFG